MATTTQLPWRTVARQCAAYLIATKQWDTLEKWLDLYNGVPCWMRTPCIVCHHCETVATEKQQRMIMKIIKGAEKCKPIDTE